jgi:hypothetical protein
MALKLIDWRWLIWWKLDERALAREIEAGDNLPAWKSSRGISLFLTLFNTALICAVIFLNPGDSYSLAQSGVFLLLGGLIFMRQRWAMLLAMLCWTAMQGFSVWQFAGHGLAGTVVAWTVYMHAVYAAWKVEQARQGETHLAAAA